MDIHYHHTLSVADYNRLRTSVGWGAIEAGQARTGINNSSYLIAAVHEDRTVGLARVVSDGGYVALIVDVIVLPEYQGRGIGREMMARVMAHIHSGLQRGQGIMVNLMAAKDKELFYEQFGFVRRPNETMGCGMVQWVRHA
jgi:GNAT superfamily N-acetyltransferase